ncbi:hypothetical protein EFA46_013965 (plasmid) [Halarchaeum sp. CBA1220]|uniref:hypothetical protein n=1 Tax=Halarchaeum sp. CBA1220 TaxID=1853682 RepID=UPI000F3AA6A3|nr:hypothetical protein [Halarchaeum sp. CBA1220]QLC35361.1 hypothetical protein EFA46_013965 [Halarchaeum sp. CBA1220]
MSAQEPQAGVVTCPACDLHAAVDEPNDAIDLYRRHTSVTGHDVEWERVAVGDAVTTADVKDALVALGDDYPEGVPLGVLTAALAERGVTIAATLDALYDLRMSGEIYEPRDDHVLAV